MSRARLSRPMRQESYSAMRDTRHQVLRLRPPATLCARCAAMPARHGLDDDDGRCQARQARTRPLRDGAAHVGARRAALRHADARNTYRYACADCFNFQLTPPTGRKPHAIYDAAITRRLLLADAHAALLFDFRLPRFRAMMPRGQDDAADIIVNMLKRARRSRAWLRPRCARRPRRWLIRIMLPRAPARS